MLVRPVALSVHPQKRKISSLALQRLVDIAIRNCTSVGTCRAYRYLYTRRHARLITAHLRICRGGAVHLCQSMPSPLVSSSTKVHGWKDQLVARHRGWRKSYHLSIAQGLVSVLQIFWLQIAVTPAAEHMRYSGKIHLGK